MGAELKFTPPKQLDFNRHNEEFLTARLDDGVQTVVRAVPSDEMYQLGVTGSKCALCVFAARHSNPTAEVGCGGPDGAPCSGVYWIPVTTYLTLKLTK
jgi:hypothetical protein